MAGDRLSDLRGSSNGNKSYTCKIKSIICAMVWYIRQGKHRNKVNSPLHMIWGDIRDCLEGDMTPLAGMTS